MPDNTTRIAALRAILEAGVTSTTVDGTSVAIDLAQVRLELNRLVRTDSASQLRRPRLSSVNLSRLR